jgi:hypothetical protein
MSYSETRIFRDATKFFTENLKSYLEKVTKLGNWCQEGVVIFFGYLAVWVLLTTS